jgi:hypothetical protein
MPVSSPAWIMRAASTKRSRASFMSIWKPSYSMRARPWPMPKIARPFDW